MNRVKQRSLFGKEYELLERAKKLLETKNQPLDCLTGEYRSLTSHFECLLNDFVKVLKISDINEHKLLCANQQIQQQTTELSRANGDLKMLNRSLQETNDNISKLLEQISRQSAELERVTLEDSLTGLPNRRFLDRRLVEEFTRACRYNKPLTVVMVDLDYFKRINDHFSHAIGDQVLKTASVILEHNCRKVDFVARYGGDEFVLIFPETENQQATVVCERIRTQIEANDWSAIQLGLTVTVSVGLCDDRSVTDPLKMLSKADDMLYQSKQNGRNQVTG